MEEPFLLEVEYKGKEQAFQAQLQHLGYIHRFVITLPETEIWLERDEEGSYRAILPPDTQEKVATSIDPHLLQLLTEKLEEILS